MVKWILKLEGLALLLLTLYLYNIFNGDWILFIILLFVPDISMIGYLKDKTLGAHIYNLMHNYVLVVILLALGIILNYNTFFHLGLILMAHVSLDRMLGFGLKYASKFKDTHLQKV